MSERVGGAVEGGGVGRDTNTLEGLTGKKSNDDAHARQTSPTTAALSNRGGFQRNRSWIVYKREEWVLGRTLRTTPSVAADTNRLRLILFNVLRTPPTEFSLVSATTIMAANRRAFYQHIRSLLPDRRDIVVNEFRRLVKSLT